MATGVTPGTDTLAEASGSARRTERKTARVFFLINCHHTQSDVKDAANWPNVRTNISTHAPTDGTYPQPFKGVNPATFEDSSSDWLEHLDGGSNHEKAPLTIMFIN